MIILCYAVESSSVEQLRRNKRCRYNAFERNSVTPDLLLTLNRVTRQLNFIRD